MTSFTPGATTFTPRAVVRPKATGALGGIISATAERERNALLARSRMIRPGSTRDTNSASADLSGGYCRMSKSGVEIRLARQFAGGAR
jgi:hypothetical protein